MLTARTLEWFLDIGATDHITGNPGNLHSLTPYTGSEGVMVGNGDVLQITHIGQANIKFGHDSLQLNDVLLVPNIKKDLISVSKLTSDLPLKFEFDGDGFVIKDRSTNRVVAKGTKKDGLYALVGESKDGSYAEAFFSSRFRSVDNECWHQRLGHPHQRVIDHLRIKKFISLDIKNKFSTICTSFQMGKSCRLPFLSVEHEIKTPFRKIHCDLWGLAPVRSREQF